MSATHSTTAATMPPLPEQEGVRFRHMPGFPGYAVGDDGSVWSCKVTGAGKGYTTAWRRRNPCPHPSGHLRLHMRGPNCERVTMYVHRLVLEAFVGPCPEGMEACHDPDRDPANNRLSNLRWDTHRENVNDAIRHGTHGRTRLSDENVREIRAVYRRGDPEFGAKPLARRFGISHVHVIMIVRRETRSLVN